MKNNIAVVGANGKMGHLVCEKLKAEFNVIKVTIENPLSEEQKPSLVIDFANAKSSVSSAEFCVKHKIPLIVASTGQTQIELDKIKNFSKIIPVMICPNLSIGISKIKKMIQALLPTDNFDITIFEKHHKNKLDKPSGTAKILAKTIFELTGKNPEILSERGGNEIGTHRIDFYYENECISIKHQCFSREVFANGAVQAIKFMLRQSNSGLYSFDDIN